MPTTVSISVFLILVGFEGYTSWFPNLFPAGKNRRAAKTVEAIAAQGAIAPMRESAPVESVLIAQDFIPYWRDKFLAPINFSVKQGETLVIVGASGVGKSTLVSALLQLAPYEGSLTIGGAEVREINAMDGYLVGTLQNSYIFNTSLRENLKIARAELTDSELLDILEAVELGYIPLDEVLGQFGRPLSGGEAKRLAIARALLSSAPIVVLDEPLEHLDRGLAERIQIAISKRMRGRALIVITHTPWSQYSRKLELTRE
jgi:ATP-binding cassette subfamily C protein CydC